ncbi:hypothetical protein EDC94DRAFT_617939 [Helicostylum pulchrum]|nr:hypothetical protein EDC94DRAFT_617939 [Helicostylum pulchrum]
MMHSQVHYKKKCIHLFFISVYTAHPLVIIDSKVHQTKYIYANPVPLHHHVKIAPFFFFCYLFILIVYKPFLGMNRINEFNHLV